MRKKGMFLIFLLLIAAAALFAWQTDGFRPVVGAREIAPGEKPVTNPYKGFMAWGENYREDPLIRLAYVPVYWDELEPEEGVYDFRALEERCHFEQWREAGVHLVLRLVLDNPTEEPHIDLPQWLYEKMDGAGTWYDCSYGKGFSPDYTSPVLQQAHSRLIGALAERYARDPQVAFIELGSLGHWGEWHVHESAGIARFPGESVSDRYVQPYLEAFGPDRLLLRRPFTIGAREGMGLYNDSFGIPESHLLWLDWIENGYVSDQNGETLPAMGNFWEKAPSGGEFSPSEDMAWYFSETQFPTTMELLDQSHTTFLGPNAPQSGELTGNAQDNLRQFLARMGYCLGVRCCTVRKSLLSGKLDLTTIWENTGIAPLYAAWPIELEIRGESGEILWEKRYEQDFRPFLPGTFTLSFSLEGTENLKKGSYFLYIGIVDPMTGIPAVELQMDTERDGNQFLLVQFEI